MAKTKLEIKPKCIDNLKELCKDEKITQITLSERIGISQNTISKILNGKSPMSHYVATEIHRVFPRYRIDWLMGDSEHKTDAEKGLTEFAEWNDEWQKRLYAVRILAYLAGYEIDLFPQNNGMSLDEVFARIKSGYQITQNGEVLGYCPLERFNLLALDIQELTEQRIKSYLREVSKDGND